MAVDSPIIVALDLPTPEEAIRVAEQVKPFVGAFKVGLGLLHQTRADVIGALNDVGRPVFADAKLHDIPSQVESAAFQLGARGARWVTAHISGGVAMLEAANLGLHRGTGPNAAGILGVSVLTSLDEAALEAVGILGPTDRVVATMAIAATQAGCEGIVCSPMELGTVRDAAPTLLRVTPGVRPHETSDDQARTATPREAISEGSDLLVIGRPITASADPAEAAEAILSGITDPDFETR